MVYSGGGASNHGALQSSATNISIRFFTASSRSSSSSRRQVPRQRHGLESLVEEEVEMLERELAQRKRKGDALEAKVLELEAILGRDTEPTHRIENTLAFEVREQIFRRRFGAEYARELFSPIYDSSVMGMQGNRALWAAGGESVGNVLREPGVKRAKKEPGSIVGVGGGAMDVEESEEEEIPRKESKSDRKADSSSLLRVTDSASEGRYKRKKAKKRDEYTWNRKNNISYHCKKCNGRHYRLIDKQMCTGVKKEPEEE